MLATSQRSRRSDAQETEAGSGAGGRAKGRSRLLRSGGVREREYGEGLHQRPLARASSLPWVLSPARVCASGCPRGQVSARWSVNVSEAAAVLRGRTVHLEGLCTWLSVCIWHSPACLLALVPGPHSLAVLGGSNVNIPVVSPTSMAAASLASNLAF